MELVYHPINKTETSTQATKTRTKTRTCMKNNQNTQYIAVILSPMGYVYHNGKISELYTSIHLTIVQFFISKNMFSSGI